MRLRPGRSEHDLKRRSTLDPAGLFKRSDKADKNDKSTELLTPNRIAVSEDGGRPASSEVARPSVSRDSHDSHDSHDSPPSPQRLMNPRRFSVLRFRHASDSQLSTTAKEHAARDAPPVPPVPVNATERSNERM